MLVICAALIVSAAAVTIGLSTGSSPCPPWQGDDDLIECYDAMRITQ